MYALIELKNVSRVSQHSRRNVINKLISNSMTLSHCKGSEFFPNVQMS